MPHRHVPLVERLAQRAGDAIERVDLGVHVGDITAFEERDEPHAPAEQLELAVGGCLRQLHDLP